MSDDSIKKYETDLLGLSASELGLAKAALGPIDQVVTFSVSSSVFSEYIATLVDEISTRLYDVGGHVSNMVRDGSFELYFHRYVATLIKSRVDHCRNRRGSAPRLTHRDRVWIPAFLCVILHQIGYVHDSVLNVRYLPEYGLSEDFEVLERDEALKFGEQLFLLEDFGFVGGVCLPRDTHGDVSFMSFVLMEGEIRRHDDLAPEVKSLLFSVLAVEATSFALTPRVSYGYTGKMVSLVRRFAKPNERRL